MTHIRREIIIAIVEDIDTETIGIEVTVPEGMTTLEAIGLIEIGKTQHLQSKHNQGPTVHQTPTGLPDITAEARPLPLITATLTGWLGCDLPGHRGCDPWNCRWDGDSSCTCPPRHRPADPNCPVHHGRRARGPKPPAVGPGCICDGSGRTCPRHGAVI